VNLRRPSRKSSPRPNGEQGFTLIEVVISVVLLTLITGVLTAALISSLNQSSSTNAHTHQSNYAQITATWFERDAQAAGGIDPTTGGKDPTLGVSTTGAFTAGCTTTGTALVGFAWNDLASGTKHVANYSYVAATHELTRTSCIGGTGAVTQILVYDVTSAPTVWCDGNVGPACPAFPVTVNMTVTDNTAPPAGTSPYTFTLTGTLRSQSQAVINTTATPAPLILLGGGGCTNGATGLSLQSASLQVSGQTYVNTPNVGGCPAMKVTGSTYPTATAILTGGTCTGCTSPKLPTTYTTPLTDPYATLAAPTGGTPRSAGNTCNGQSGTLQPGVYTAPITVTAGLFTTCTLVSGVYIIQSNMTVSGNLLSILTPTIKSASGGVLLYFTGGGSFTAGGLVNLSLSPITSGNGIVMWQSDAAPVQMGTASGGLNSFDINGVIYSPNAPVSFANLSAGLNLPGIVAQSLTLQSNVLISVGAPPPPIQVGGPNSLPAWTVNQPGYPTTQFTATGGFPPYKWSSDNLPAGLTIDPDTGVVSGPTPTATFNGNVHITAGDGFGDPSDTNNVQLTINAQPKITSTTLPSWTVGRPYPNTQVATSGGTAPFKWTITGLPSGLQASSAGAITGTPNGAPGTANVNVSLTDAAGATATATLPLTINAGPTITPAALPNGEKTAPYSFSVASWGAGGTPPYKWSATGLPNNLTINQGSGLISGTPNGNPGTSQVKITLTDAAGVAVTTANIPLVITAQPTITSVTLANHGAAAGTIETGDTITIVYSAQMKVSSFCSAWTTGDTNDQSLTAANDVTVTLTDGNFFNNDSIAATSGSCAGGFQFGSIDLGSKNYANGTSTFKGNGTTSTKSTITWTASTHTLVITLGTRTGGNPGNVNTSQPTYNADNSVTDSAGAGLSNIPFQLANAKQF